LKLKTDIDPVDGGIYIGYI